jgi:hypothetical protein
MKYILILTIILVVSNSCRYNDIKNDTQYDCFTDNLKNFKLQARKYVDQVYINDTSIYREFSHNSDYKSEFLYSNQIHIYLHTIYINDSLLSLEFHLSNSDSLANPGKTYIARLDKTGEPIQELYPVFVSYHLLTDSIRIDGYYDYYLRNDYNHEGFITNSIPVEIDNALIDSLLINGVNFHNCQ